MYIMKETYVINHRTNKSNSGNILFAQSAWAVAWFLCFNSIFKNSSFSFTSDGAISHIIFELISKRVSVAAIHRCSQEKVFWKSVAALQENTYCKATLLKSYFGMGVNLLHIFRTPFPKNTYERLLLQFTFKWPMVNSLAFLVLISWRMFIVMLCAIWYHLHNLKNMKNTHGGVLPF